MGLLAVEGSYDNMYKMLECAPPLSHTHTHTHTHAPCAPCTFVVARGHACSADALLSCLSDAAAGAGGGAQPACTLRTSSCFGLAQRVTLRRWRWVPHCLGSLALEVFAIQCIVRHLPKDSHNTPPTWTGARAPCAGARGCGRRPQRQVSHHGDDRFRRRRCASASTQLSRHTPSSFRHVSRTSRRTAAARGWPCGSTPIRWRHSRNGPCPLPFHTLTGSGRVGRRRQARMLWTPLGRRRRCWRFSAPRSERRTCLALGARRTDGCSAAT